MKNLLTLFFVFLSFNVYSQNDDKKTPNSAISSLEVTELEQLILSKDPVKLKEDSAKSKYDSVLKQIIHLC